MCLTEETQLIPSKCRMRKIHRLGYGTCVYKSWIHGRDPQTADKSTRLRPRIAGHFQNLVADSSLGNRLPSPERVNALHLSPRPLNAIFKNVRERRPVPEPVWTPFFCGLCTARTLIVSLLLTAHRLPSGPRTAATGTARSPGPAPARPRIPASLGRAATAASLGRAATGGTPLESRGRGGTLGTTTTGTGARRPGTKTPGMRRTGECSRSRTLGVELSVFFVVVVV